MVVGEPGRREAGRSRRVKACLRSPAAIPDGTGLDPPRPARSRPGRAHPRPHGGQPMSHGQAPTSKQLNYLRALAERTGTTFVPPTDRRQASSEIERLRHLKRRNNDAEPTDEGCESVYSTAPAADEIAGWGASATWCTTRRHSGRPAEVSDGRTRSSEEDGQGSCWLGRYPDVKGVAREIIDVALSHGRLVIDRCVDGGHDPRLVGRLEPDEPPENARLLA